MTASPPEAERAVADRDNRDRDVRDDRDGDEVVHDGEGLAHDDLDRDAHDDLARAA